MMKIGKSGIKQFILIAVIILSYKCEVFSQGTDIQGEKHTGIFVGLVVAPTQSQIINEEIQDISELLSTKKFTFSGYMEIGYFFLNSVGLSSGIGFASYQTQLTLESYQNNFITIDSETEIYERRIIGSGITEVQKLGFLSIPVCLNLRLPIKNSLGFFFKPGVNMEIPLSKKYSSNGTFTYNGYYSAYNVLIEDIPEYGFPKNQSTATEGDLELKSLSFSVIASAGLDFMIRERIQIGVGACYSKSLTTISNYSSPENFQLSSVAGQINSFQGGSTKVSVQAIGVNLSFRYYLR
jgi:hypothetical protein